MFDLDHVFSYHVPTADQPAKYEAIRSAGKALAAAIVENTPSCADQSAALRKVCEAVMTANASIALSGRLDVPNIDEGFARPR